jgi:hypothetical protein
MGASVAHGPELQKTREILEDGSESVEIVPSGGDYAFPTYSSVAELVRYASSKGIESALWPIYYDHSDSDVDLEIVYQQCEHLKQALSRLSDDDIQGNRWLRRVADWLKSGERFYITE